MKIFGRTFGNSQQDRASRENEANQRRENRQLREAASRQKEQRRHLREQEVLRLRKETFDNRTALANSRAGLAEAKSKKVLADRKRAPFKGTAQTLISFLGATKGNRKGVSAKPRALYMSSSHGLVRLKTDDPRYIEAMKAQQGIKPVQVRSSSDVGIGFSDDNDQPPAFRGL